MGSLTQFQKSIILGTILGDGCLRIVKGRKDALLEINHSFKAKDYVDWKYAILKNICRSSPKIRRGNENRIAYRFTTRQNKYLTRLYNKFYIDGKKKVINSLQIDPIVLAVWFMDDGSKCRDRDVYLNTQQFSYSEQLGLIDCLKEIGLTAMVNRDKKYFRLRFKKDSVKELNKMISRHIIPSMKYKLSYDPVET